MTAQSMQALARANEIRLARAQLKRDIKAGRVSVAQVIVRCPECIETMALLDLVCCQPKFGRHKSRRLLRDLALSESRHVGTLTHNERRMVADILAGVAA